MLGRGRRGRTGCSPGPRPPSARVSAPVLTSWTSSRRATPSPRGPRRRRLSKSATKTRIEPEHARRNVDIPRLRSPLIPARSAFVADLDTDRVRTGFGPGPTGPTRPARPTCLRFRFSPPLPGPNMAPREDRSGAHPTARPSEPRNHAETDGHTRGGGPNDPPRAPESGPGPGPRSPPTPPRSARATDSDTPRPTSPIRPTQTHPE